MQEAISPPAPSIRMMNQDPAARNRTLGRTALDRLERNGFVSSSVGDPTPARGGRAKRLFQVTPAGIDAVKSTQFALVSLWTGIPELKGAAS